MQASRAVSELDRTKASRILDVGSGYGRLAIGLLELNINTYYLGVDVHQGAVRWCSENITSCNKNYEFKHTNVKNDRYNPRGNNLEAHFSFELEENFDLIYLYSVFSHMLERDMIIYLNALKSVLAPKGKLYFTTFVKADSHQVTYNPKGVIKSGCFGPLHVVLYNKTYLESLIDQLGWKIERVFSETESDGQTGYMLSLL